MLFITCQQLSIIYPKLQNFTESIQAKSELRENISNLCPVQRYLMIKVILSNSRTFAICLGSIYSSWVVKDNVLWVKWVWIQEGTEAALCSDFAICMSWAHQWTDTCTFQVILLFSLVAAGQWVSSIGRHRASCLCTPADSVSNMPSPSPALQAGHSMLGPLQKNLQIEFEALSIGRGEPCAHKLGCSAAPSRAGAVSGGANDAPQRSCWHQMKCGALLSMLRH